MKAPHRALDLAEFVEREFPIAWGPSTGCYPWRLLSWAANEKNPRLPAVEEVANEGLSFDISSALMGWAEAGIAHQPDDRTLVLSLCGLVLAESAAVAADGDVFDHGAAKFFKAGSKHLPAHIFDRACHEWMAAIARTFGAQSAAAKIAHLPKDAAVARRWTLAVDAWSNEAALRELLDAQSEELSYRWHALNSLSPKASDTLVDAARRHVASVAAISLKESLPDRFEILGVARASRYLKPQEISKLAPRAMFFVAKGIAEGRAAPACAIYDGLSIMDGSSPTSFAQAFSRANLAVPGPHTPAFGRAGIDMLRRRPDLARVLGTTDIEAVIAPMLSSSNARMASAAVDLTLEALGLRNAIGPMVDARIYSAWGPATAKTRAEWGHEPHLGSREIWSKRLNDLIEELAARPGLDAPTRLPALRRLRARDEHRAEHLVISGIGSARDYRALTLEFVAESRTRPVRLIEALAEIDFSPEEVTDTIVSLESRWPGCADALLQRAFERAREPGKEQTHADAFAKLLELRYQVSVSARAKWIEELESYSKEGWNGSGAVAKAIAVMKADQAFATVEAPEQSLIEAIEKWVEVVHSLGSTISGKREWVPPALTARLAQLIADEVAKTPEGNRARAITGLSALFKTKAHGLEPASNFLGNVLRRLMADASGLLDDAEVEDLDAPTIFRELRLMSASVGLPVAEPSLLLAELALQLAGERGISASYRSIADETKVPRRTYHLCPDELSRLIGSLLTSVKEQLGAHALIVEASPARVHLTFPNQPRAGEYASKLLAWMQGEKVEGFRHEAGSQALRQILERNGRKQFRLGLDANEDRLQLEIEWLSKSA